VLLDSNDLPLSGAGSLNLLEQKDTINKLQESGFIISDFTLVVPPTSESAPIVQKSNLQSKYFWHLYVCIRYD